MIPRLLRYSTGGFSWGPAQLSLDQESYTKAFMACVDRGDELSRSVWAALTIEPSRSEKLPGPVSAVSAGELERRYGRTVSDRPNFVEAFSSPLSAVYARQDCVGSRHWTSRKFAKE